MKQLFFSRYSGLRHQRAIFHFLISFNSINSLFTIEEIDFRPPLLR